MHFRRAFLSPALTDILLVSPAQQGRQAACSSSSCMHHGRVTSFTSSSSVKFRRRGVLLVTLLPAAQGSPFLVSSLWNARRFAACGRTPTFTELSEAFSILGVDVDCDKRQLKKVYRDLVRKNHPDAGGDAAAMSRITVAYNRLVGLSNMEREQFKTQRNAYRGGSYYASSSSSNGAGVGHSPTSPGYASYNTQGSGPMHGFYDASNSDYFRQKATHPHGYYSYHQHNRSYTENPFSSSNPFSFHTHMRRAWSMPMGSLLLRGFVMYLGLSVLLLLLYRRYRDWLHDDGWKMAESLARQEQMSEMHRLRQEMNERLRAARDAAAAHNSSVRAYVNRGENNTDYNAVNSSRGHELRALEYARRRQIELSEELKGWPQFGEEKGKLIRRAQDPPGVVFFEPRKEDQLARQMQTMQRGREWSNMKQAAAETSNNNNKNNNSASNGPAVNTAAAAATVAATAGGAPADRDAVSAMNSIFSGVWGGGRRTTPSSSE